MDVVTKVPSEAGAEEGVADQKKWHGIVRSTAEVPRERLWEIASDFCGLCKWMPLVESCELIGEDERTPGCVRCVLGTSIPREDGEKSWAKERLLSFDAESHSFTYAVEDDNMGFAGYVSSFQLLDGPEETKPSTMIEWSFHMNPIANISEADAVNSTASILQKAVEGLVRAAAQGPTGDCSTATV